MHQVFLGLGTNLGDKEANLKAAIEEITKRVGKITSLSAFYVTEPWGFHSDHSFLNAVCCIQTEKTPFEVLLFDRLSIHTPELTIPHPLMLERDFVMKPLEEIAPEIVQYLKK